MAAKLPPYTYIQNIHGKWADSTFGGGGREVGRMKLGQFCKSNYFPRRRMSSQKRNSGGSAIRLRSLGLSKAYELCVIPDDVGMRNLGQFNTISFHTRLTLFATGADILLLL